MSVLCEQIKLLIVNSTRIIRAILFVNFQNIIQYMFDCNKRMWSCM